MAVSFRDVTKRFNGTVALDSLSLDLGKAGIVAIIGPNGAGKTTLLDLATGRLAPDDGEVVVGGKILGRSDQPYIVSRRGVARTFQELKVFRQMTALENLMAARAPQRGESLWRALFGFGWRQEEECHLGAALQILRRVGLGSQRGDLAGELSYGQQKILSLAQCMATDSQILLLDEPVAGVHSRVVETISQVLQEMASEGRLVVFVEHDIGTVRRLADRVVVMDQGRVVADGHPEEVLARADILEAYIA